MSNQDEILNTDILNELNESNKSFDFKSLLSDDKFKEYMGKNVDMNKISELLGNGPTQESKQEEEDPALRREELRRKLRAKTNSLKGNRMSKQEREKNQINELKKNPMFQNAGLAGGNNDDIKNMIDAYASKMTNDPKQKKNIKKQMDSLIEKMNTM